MDRDRGVRLPGASPWWATTTVGMLPDAGSSSGVAGRRGVGAMFANLRGRHPGRGLSLERMGGADTEGIVSWLRPKRQTKAEASPALHTIKEVVEACGLPGPVIMQLCPRTWTDQGWMYTTEQLAEAVVIAAEHRRALTAPTDAVPYR